ncbi:GNAT family N-acetyltransferase [Streptomyces abikoensis]|uniref:GNAT family N-acetyltransferase n=1 Tax=Streptomyces abikoensis TaxID=97398 RepID=UPI001674278D|nr:GNAT family N-acetyltransferase [Streptomyces abikoensis]GGP57567.1 UPF0256 protein [Streptomyces abikoensis]
MTTDLRVLRPTDWDQWYGTLELAFGGVPETPEERTLWRELTRFDRSIGAWDGPDVVGSAGSFAFRMAVPGGSLVPAAGVTMVGVRPTHRRQGVLTSMMRHLLEGVRERREPLAALTASEPGIYGRFGYGIATHRIHARVDTSRVRLVIPEDPSATDGSYATDGVRIRLSAPEDARAACEEVYARRVTTRPGMLARQPAWDAVPLLDPVDKRDGASPLNCVLAEADGETVGYARYAIRPSWDRRGPRGTVVLRDLEALTPAARAALWRYLFGLDLTSEIDAFSLPVDDPLLQLVDDIRRCDVQVADQLHLRLVDVGDALAARTYAAPVDVVLDVTDAFCPWNTGRWRLTGDAKGATCARTRDAADLALSARELGAAYLGGTSLAALAGAGRVRELREGALAEASVAFTSAVAPWLPHGF